MSRRLDCLFGVAVVCAVLGIVVAAESPGSAPWFFLAALVAALGAIVPRVVELTIGISKRERSDGR